MGLGGVLRSVGRGLGKAGAFAARARQAYHGYDDRYVSAQAAALQRALMIEDEERRSREEDRAFNRQMREDALADRREAQRLRRAQALESHLDDQGGGEFGPEPERPLPPWLTEGFSPEEVAIARGGATRRREARAAAAQAKTQAEAEKNAREFAEAIALQRAAAEIARGTHAANRRFDLDNPTPEHAKDKDYTGRALQILSARRTATGLPLQPPTGREVAAYARQLEHGDTLFRDPGAVNAPGQAGHGPEANPLGLGIGGPPQGGGNKSGGGSQAPNEPVPPEVAALERALAGMREPRRGENPMYDLLRTRYPDAAPDEILALIDQAKGQTLGVSRAARPMDATERALDAARRRPLSVRVPR